MEFYRHLTFVARSCCLPIFTHLDIKRQGLFPFDRWKRWVTVQVISFWRVKWSLQKRTGPLAPAASGCSPSRRCCFLLRSRNTFMSVGSLRLRTSLWGQQARLSSLSSEWWESQSPVWNGAVSLEPGCQPLSDLWTELPQGTQKIVPRSTHSFPRGLSLHCHPAVKGGL